MLRFCTLFFRPRTRPRTSLQCFALDSRCSKAKHCRDVLGRVLGRNNKVQNPSLSFGECTARVKLELTDFRFFS